MVWLVGLWGKTKFYALAIAGAVGALFVGYWRIREDGKAAERLEQAQAREKLQERYDEVDRHGIDPAGSYDRLRKLPIDKGGR